MFLITKETLINHPTFFFSICSKVNCVIKKLLNKISISFIQKNLCANTITRALSENSLLLVFFMYYIYLYVNCRHCFLFVLFIVKVVLNFIIKAAVNYSSPIITCLRTVITEHYQWNFVIFQLLFLIVYNSLHYI